jgi:hypothetical protein
MDAGWMVGWVDSECRYHGWVGKWVDEWMMGGWLDGWVMDE